MKKRSAPSGTKLIIIGEAAKHIPEPFLNDHPEIAWRDMCGMRDILTHAYFKTDPAMLYKTSAIRIPQQKPLLKKYIPQTLHSQTTGKFRRDLLMGLSRRYKISDTRSSADRGSRAPVEASNPPLTNARNSGKEQHREEKSRVKTRNPDSRDA